MDHEVAQFLVDFSEFLPLCNSVDIAGVAIEQGGQLELLSIRCTAGSAQDSLPDAFHKLGPWRVFRYRRPVTNFPIFLRAISESGPLQLDDTVNLVGANPIKFYRSGFARAPGIFANVPARITWLGGSYVGKTFSSNSEHEQFSRLVATSYDYHDVAQLVSTLGLRQDFLADEMRGVRFEIEPPVYFKGTEWSESRIVLHFTAPQNADLKEIRVKWQTKKANGEAILSRGADIFSAEAATDEDYIDATVVYRTFGLLRLSEARPQKLIDFFPDVDRVDLPEVKVGPDYSKYGTTRRTLRISIRKQLSGDPTLLRIVERDIDHAVMCLEEGRYKLAAILAGAIVEATLIGRLSGESVSDLEAAFRAAFPSHSTAKPVPALDDLKLAQLIAVADKRRKLKDHKLYDGVRDWRNFVHPKLEATRGSIDVTAAKIAVTAAVRLLLQKS